MTTPPLKSQLNPPNPYASFSQSTYPRDTDSGHQPDPESPSTMLLHELTGSKYPQSPTPTPTSHTFRPSHILSNPSSEDEDDGPPQSIMYGQAPVIDALTPRSPPIILPSHPDPFRHPGPPRSSASGSTSPGPSTMSVYASGLDHTTITEQLGEASTSTSTEEGRPAPTFREVPDRPLSRGKMLSPKGYMDPALPGQGTSFSRKGKGKATKSKRRHPEPQEESRGRYAGFGRGVVGKGKSGLDAYERALWKWVNVEDLDGFLQEVYAYYKGKGIYCIALASVLNLLTTFFVIAFSTFLLSCIDYPKLTSSVSHPGDIGRLDNVLVKQCLTRGSFPHLVFNFAVTAFYIFQLVTFLFSLPRLLEMYRFYTHLLGVPDADIQTLPWPEIVRLIGEIRKHNPVTSLSNGKGALASMMGEQSAKTTKLDAHDVANRILRQENYLIALFNKDLLDLRVRLPIPHQIYHLVPSNMLIASPNPSQPLPTNTVEHEKKYLSFGGNTLTKALEWNLRYCLLGYLFDGKGMVRKEFVREKRRGDLVEGQVEYPCGIQDCLRLTTEPRRLKRRFVFMGIINALFAPFIVLYLLMYSFFRYFEEYHKNPSSIGGRKYTPYAQWKFREFNELPHLFERRLDRSYPVAKEYVDQFPKEKTALVMRFVAFVAGSFAAVLLVASLIDPDLFLHFEITPHRTVLFYLGVFGSVLAIARGMIPEENLVFDPEMSLREVVRWTHYLPGEWKGKLHSQMVHEEFGTLFALKITTFTTELLSVLLTPFILFFSLPPCASAIIDFFREFTVHVEGVGYVCSFAVFDFKRNGISQNGSSPLSPSSPTNPKTRLPNPNQRANENKMEKSFLHFKATHPDWQPSDPATSIFLDKLMGAHLQIPPQPMNGSAYGAGGRGLGLGVDDRSRGGGLGWQRSNQYLRPSPGTVLEDLDEDEEEENEDWNKRVVGGESEDENEGEGEGFMKDVGMMGLLQQVLNR